MLGAVMLVAASGRSVAADTGLSAPGLLDVSFFFDTPASVEPTYHTAIWLEDATGKIVKTLFVSQELSGTQYKTGEACPDWVNKAHWEDAPASEVAAVTAPTPSVGVAEMRFDLASFGLAPGVYGFRLQVHITEEYNVLYRGAVTVGGPATELTLETAFGPGKLDSTEQFIRDVRVRYVPAK